MPVASRIHPKKVARRLGSPVRGFFNNHFAMVKAEVVAGRTELTHASSELAQRAAQLATESQRVDDAATFLGARLGRLLDQQELTESALRTLTDKVDVLHELVKSGQSPGVRSAVWSGFVGRAAAGYAPGSKAFVVGDATAVTMLTAFGLDVVFARDQDRTSVDVLVVLAPPGADGTALIPTAALRPGGRLVLATDSDTGESAPDGYAIEERVVAGGLRMISARRV